MKDFNTIQNIHIMRSPAIGLTSFVIISIFAMMMISCNQHYDLTNCTVPQNLSLQIKENGHTYYVTQEEWAKVPKKQQEQVEKLGIVVTGNLGSIVEKDNNLEFILSVSNLTDKYLTWDQAMSSYRTQLPDRWQGQVIMNQKDAINAALKGYGLSPMVYCFWTSTERTPDHAEFIKTDNDPDPFGASKTNVYGVRGVKPIPGAETKFKRQKKEIFHKSNIRLINDIYLNDLISEVGVNYDLICTKDNGVEFSAYGRVPDEIAQWFSFPIYADGFSISETDGKITRIQKVISWAELKNSSLLDGWPSGDEIFHRLVEDMSQRLGQSHRGAKFAGASFPGVTWKNENRNIYLMLVCDDPLMIYLTIGAVE